MEFCRVQGEEGLACPLPRERTRGQTMIREIEGRTGEGNAGTQIGKTERNAAVAFLVFSPRPDVSGPSRRSP